MRPRTLLVSAVLVTLLGACGGTSPSSVDASSTSATPTSPSPLPSIPSTTATGAPSPSASITSPSPAPANVPENVPLAYDHDVPAADVQAKALVPPGTTVQGRSFATTSDGEAIVVSWVEPGDDPFRSASGWVEWRRFEDDPPWRPIVGETHPAADGVLGITALTADLTGDGSDDALVFASTGGTGACGIWSVADLAAGSVVFRRELCDAAVQPSTAPVGLVVTSNVYRDGDPHCCPSAFRTTVLTYGGQGTWAIASKVTTPA